VPRDNAIYQLSQALVKYREVPVPGDAQRSHAGVLHGTAKIEKPEWPPDAGDRRQPNYDAAATGLSRTTYRSMLRRRASRRCSRRTREKRHPDGHGECELSHGAGHDPPLRPV